MPRRSPAPEELLRRAVRPVLETLEARRLLSVSYNAALRLVTASGGAGSDSVVLSHSLGNQLDVNENGTDYFFNLSDVDHINVFLTGDNGNDLVIVNPLFSGTRALTMTLDTGGGSDTFRALAAGGGSAFTLGERNAAWTFPGVGTFTVIHFNTELLEAYGSNTASDTFANGPDVARAGFEISCYGQGGNDSMTIGQAVVNATTGGNLYFTGGAGTDTFNVDASANTGPTNLRVINYRVEMSGSTRQGQFFETEQSNLIGGSGNDVFTIDAFHNGAALAISGNNGDDVARFTPTSGDISTNISNIASFNFDGGNGSDALVLFNHNTTGSWNYFRTNTVLQAQNPASGYNLTLGNTNNEDVDALSGGQYDQFFVESAPSGSLTQLNGGNGQDFYILGQLSQNSQNILGTVEVNDGGATGGDSIIIDDRSDTVGRTVHVTASTIGAVAGDTMFGPGGSLTYLGIEDVISVSMGSGSDTVFVKPNIASVSLDGDDPTSAPGDTLNASMATATNPSHSPSTPGNGFIHYDDGPGISYTTFETVNFDVVAPATTDITFDPTFGAQSIAFTFDNADAAGSLSNTSLSLSNNTTFTTIHPSKIALSFVGNVATFTFPGLSGTLPDGDYTAELVGATDAAGNDVSGDTGYRFIWASDGGIADVYRVKANPFNFNIEVYRNSITPQTLVYTADPLLLDMIALHGGVNDDVLHLDLTGGNPIPPDGINFQGSPGDTDHIDVDGKPAFADSAIFNAGEVVVGGRTLTYTDVEDVRFDGARGHDTLVVNSGVPVNIYVTQDLDSLTVGTAGTVSLAPTQNIALMTRTLTLSGAAKLDLTDNDVIVDYTGASSIGSWNGAAYTDVTGLIQSGRTSGGLSGVVSSSSNGNFTTLGVAEASQAYGISGAQTHLFAGETVDATAVLVKFTYGGDANLDGKINVDDYGHIDSSIPLGTTGWFNGDFNYDGKMNVDDYGIIDFNVGIQGPPLAGVANAATLASGEKAREPVRWDEFVRKDQEDEGGLGDLL